MPPEIVYLIESDRRFFLKGHRIKEKLKKSQTGRTKDVAQNDRNSKKPQREPLWKSFGYAFQGIGRTIARERNMKIHCFAAGLVVIFGCALGISRIEWFVCLILFGLVMSLECVNTSVEAVVDLVTEERKPLAKKAKDAAAGAVLIAAIFAAIIGCVIFLPKLAALI